MRMAVASHDVAASNSCLLLTSKRPFALKLTENATTRFNDTYWYLWLQARSVAC